MEELTRTKRTIDRTRTRADRTQQQLRRNTNRLNSERKKLGARLAQGAAADRISATQATIAGLEETHRELLATRTELLNEHQRLSDSILEIIAPEQLVSGLDAHRPIALLPIRIESRFVDNELRLRMFPDQIHLDAHESPLTDDEEVAGQSYWQQRWSDAESGDAAWAIVVNRFGAPRARWIVDQTTPTNINRFGRGDPDFPTLEMKADEWSETVEATALPDRFVAIGFRGDREVFRKWGRSVPDRLATSFAPDQLADEGDDVDETTVLDDEPMRWAVDYDRAVEVGMAITITDADMFDARVRGRYDRIIIVGVDWTLNPDEAAARLDDLFTSHRHTDGLDVVAPGTPTNDTGADGSHNLTPSRFSTLLRPPDDPTLGAVVDVDGPGAGLAFSLGLPTPIATTPGVDLDEDSTASLVANVAFASTLGTFLDEMLAPAVDDATISDARDHVIRWLRPGGPLPTLRIGNQPYGFLPVVTAASYEPAGRFETQLQGLLDLARPLWNDIAVRIPKLGRGDDLDATLLELLQANPRAMSASFRKVVGLGLSRAANGDDLASESRRQAFVRSMIFLYLGLPQNVTLGYATIDPESHPLPLPWVQEGVFDENTVLEPNYLTSIADTVEQTGGRATLNAQDTPQSLFDAVATHSALEELDRAASLLVSANSDGPSRASFRPAEFLGLTQTEAVLEPGSTPRGTGTLTISTPEQQAALVIPSVTGSKTVTDHIIDLIRSGDAGNDDSGAQLQEFIAAVSELAERPAAQIDRTFRSYLDATSHRLDAWYTSQATRRLTARRNSREGADGVHLGAYGFVLDLEPDREPDSLGYIHAPSPDHAATAAILRSGHLSNRDDADILDINLTSARVRLGLSLIEGVAEGQSIAALLGYRIERGVRDLGSSFGRFLLPIRRLAPFRSTAIRADDEDAQETIAAQHVVDGLRLIERWESDRATLLSKLGASAPQQTALAGVLDEVAGAYDAVGDLLVSESVFQAVRGNWERSGAALAALDRQERPPRPEVIDTPRTGTTFTQRLAVVMQDDESAAGWDVADAMSAAAPAVNAFVSRLLPPVDSVLLRGEVVVNEAAVEVDIPIAALALSPLSLVMASAGTSAGGPSALEDRIARALFATIDLEALLDPALGDDNDVRLQLITTAVADEVGVGQLLPLLRWLVDLLADSRQADATDFGPADVDADDGARRSAIEPRANAAVRLLRKLVSDLETELGRSAPRLAQLDALLNRAAEVNATDALPPLSFRVVDDADDLAAVAAETDALIEQAMLVLDELTERRDRAASIAERLGDADEPPDDRDKSEADADRLRAVFGPAFPALVPFRLGPPNARVDAVAASLASQAELTPDVAAPRDWLDDMGMVRNGADQLSQVLLASELLGSPATQSADALAVLQLPHAPGRRWLGLPIDPEAIADPTAEEVDLALVVFSPDDVDPKATWQAVIVDDWTETIPSATETTAVAFHYDAPASRAPQSVVLAVAPDLNADNWTFDHLLETVEEVIDLTVMRGAQPRLSSWFGPLLPATYIAHSFTKSRPSIDFFDLAEQFADAFVPIAGRQWEGIDL